MNTPTPPDCPLCIGNNLLSQAIIAQTGQAYLIPARSNPGNYLIIPKSHCESLADLPDTWWAEVKQLLPKAPGTDGHYNMSVNIGQHAGQTVRHIHFWVIPRHSGQPTSGKGFARLINDANLN